MLTHHLALLTTNSPDRRQRRSAELRQRLFRAALDLFAKQGFAETTVEDITNAADVGKGTFFNYFPSKDHILIAFGEMQLEKLQGLVAEASQTAQPMPAFLRTLSVRMTEEPARNPSIIRAILQGNLSSTPVREAMRKNHLRSQDLLTQLVKLGQERGEIRGDLTAEEIAQVFRQTVFGTLLMWAVMGEGSLAERMHAAFDLLWNGIAPRPSPHGVISDPSSS
ncbi:MAG: TetR family transcriptional regulator FadR [Candidatus Acidiferrum sp.]